MVATTFAADTPLAVTGADVLAWDRARGEPPLARGFTPEQEATVLAAAAAGAAAADAAGDP